MFHIITKIVYGTPWALAFGAASYQLLMYVAENASVTQYLGG